MSGGGALISVIGMGLSRVWGTRLGNEPAYVGVDQILRISNLGVLYGVKGQYVPILTLYQQHFELSESEVEVQVGAITISMARCYKRSIGESISSLDHRWLILSRFVYVAILYMATLQVLNNLIIIISLSRSI